MLFEIEDGVLKKYIGNEEKVIIPEEVTEIGSRAFEGNSFLTGVIIHDNVISIGSNAFCNCSNLRSVHINESASLKTIGSYAFGYCKKLVEFLIPDNVTQIGEKAFYKCTKLPAEAKLKKDTIFFTWINEEGMVERSYNREQALQILGEASQYQLKKEKILEAHSTKQKMGSIKIDQGNILVKNGHFCGCIVPPGILWIKNIGTDKASICVETIVTGIQGEIWHEDVVYVTLC